jgi:hypothetical protein
MAETQYHNNTSSTNRIDDHFSIGNVLKNIQMSVKLYTFLSRLALMYYIPRLDATVRTKAA